ncbi:hypothetical protein XA68_11897 [Ophiocordyceps unilateralis]|uniref:Uncharacterized protein n=1 Tax=Ophiocordyceps unilateralis TaxID=268505 RepID=A0A2A9PG08_OPHUN|nr:hypothetical protein XA68_11897 [Ophiocordyceps unilateralis]
MNKATILALSTLVGRVMGLVTAPIDGYDVFTPEWEVELSPGGRTVTLNGTIEEVYQQVVQLNPNYEQQSSTVTTSSSQKQSSTPSKVAQNASVMLAVDWNLATSLCGGKWQATSVRRVREGIGYLRRVRGRPSSLAGPSRCGRVSCAYNSAIWWCNDDLQPKALSSFAAIADGAQFLVKRCVEWMNPQPEAFGGQAFHPSGWNVIIRKDEC